MSSNPAPYLALVAVVLALAAGVSATASGATGGLPSNRQLAGDRQPARGLRCGSSSRQIRAIGMSMK